MAAPKTIFFSLLGDTKRCSVGTLNSIDDLLQAARDKFPESTELHDAPQNSISFYTKDEKFQVPFKLDGIEDLYDGAVVEIRLSSVPRPAIPVFEEKKEEAPVNRKRRAAEISSEFSVSEFVVRLRGLPWNISNADIETFFAGIAVVPGGIFISTDPIGKRSGEAFVQFSSANDLEEAKKMDRKLIGRRYVEVYQSGPEELRSAVQRSAVADGRIDTAIADDAILVKMHGLPYTATESDITTFFGALKPTAIHMVLTANGRHNGDAFVEFQSEAEATTALQLHRKNIGKRYVELVRCHPDEARRTLGLQNSAEECTALKMTGIPFSSSDHDILNFFLVAGVTPIRIHRKPGAGDALIEFAGSVEIPRAMTRNKSYMGNRYIELIKLGKVEFLQTMLGLYGALPGISPMMPTSLPSLSMPSLGSSSFDPTLASYASFGLSTPTTSSNYSANPSSFHSSSAPPSVSIASVGMPHTPPINPPPGCTLRLHGIPFKTTAQEIELFFQGFEAIPNSVRIGQDAMGRPSGEAWISFWTPDAARQALASKNLQYIGERYVRLFLE